MSRTRGTARGRRPVLILGLIGALALATCGGGASQPPTPGSSDAPGQGDTPTPTPEPIVGTDETVAPGDGSEAFSTATTALDALDSYTFRVEMKSSSTDNGTVSTSSSVYSGVVVNKPTKASSLRIVELDADGNETSGTEFVIIGTDAWLRDVAGTEWTPIPAAQVDSMFAAFRPEQMFGLYFAGYGGNFTTVGTESRNGVDTTHYKGDDAIGAVLGTIAGVNGSWSSDAWIANDGGFLVHSEAGVEAATGTEGGSFQIVVDITDPNSSGPIQAPA